MQGVLGDIFDGKKKEVEDLESEGRGGGGGGSGGEGRSCISVNSGEESDWAVTSGVDGPVETRAWWDLLLTA